MTQTPTNENTKLLSSNSPPPPSVNQASRPNASSSSSGGNSDGSMMGTFRNVFQLVHGVGETVRGTVLGTIDDWESKGERKHHDIARQGQVEMTEAYQRLWGSTSSSSAPVPSTEPRGYTSGYDAAPPTYQATGAASTSAGGDSKDASGI